MTIQQDLKISINTNEIIGKLSPFWNSTGFTPAALLHTDDMHQQIIYWGSIPNQGIKYARIHFLLELVSVTFDGENATSYDWSLLDKGLDRLVSSHICPIFELMGNPDGQFSSFRDDLQLRQWSNLIYDLARHLQERYRVEQVENWFFESWNEPDAGWWHEFPHDIKAFCNYYDACARGLKRANPNLRIGGPGTCRTLSPLFCSFLQHCDQGPDYFTSEKTIPLDFISIHEKAASANKEDLTPNTSAMVQREVDIIQYIRGNHPRFTKLPFMNNECDPQVGWNDHHTWHGRPYYAAWVVKSVWIHLDEIINKLNCNYALLGNDHGFIGGWGNRTLLTRFGSDGWIANGQSKHKRDIVWQQQHFNTPSFSMIKKPVFNAMNLLALQGTDLHPVENLKEDTGGGLNSNINVIATSDADGSYTLLVYHCQDKLTSSNNIQIQLLLENFPYQKVILYHYRIDENHGDLFNKWELAGAPNIPDMKLLNALRSVQEPVLMHEPRILTVAKKQVRLKLDLPMHAVSLIQLFPESKIPPPEILDLKSEVFSGLNTCNEHLLSWDISKSTHYPLFEINYTDSLDHIPQKLNHPTISTSAYLVTKPGYYRIRSRTPWGHNGDFSPFLHVENN